MGSDELNRITDSAEWYLKDQLDFDRRLIHFRYLTIKPYLKGPEGLEMGPAEGQMTRFLVNDFKTLTVVDGSATLLDCMPNYPNVVKVHSMFEDFNPEQRYNTIIMEHILEHVDQPVKLLRRVKQWLAPSGVILAGVPNGNSVHRLAAVKMGLLKGPCELNQRDISLGHRRVYTRETLIKDIETAGLRIFEMGGVFFKPLSNQQMQDYWTEDMILGFYELGKDFPELSAELYAVCEAI